MDTNVASMGDTIKGWEISFDEEDLDMSESIPCRHEEVYDEKDVQQRPDGVMEE
jgi:hypothetical protein